MKLAVVAVLAFLAGCKHKSEPLMLSGAATDTVAPAIAVVNGTEITKTNALGYFVLPDGLAPDAIKTVAFRYQTPCGAFDVPTKITSNKGSREIEAHPASDSAYLWGHLVIVDAGGQDPAKLAVAIGKQSLGRAPEEERLSASDGWDKARVGRIFGPECAAEHDVTVGGTLLGKLAGQAPKDLAVRDDDRFTLPIFITAKAACYRMQLRSVEYTNTKTGASSNGRSYDAVIHGPGVFYLPLVPDLFGKKPDTAEKPSGLFEVPCQPDIDSAADGSAAPGP